MAGTCRACWRGVAKLVGGRQPVKELEDPDYELGPGDVAQSPEGPAAAADAPKQAPAPFPTPAAHGDATVGVLPATLLKLDPGIAALRRGGETFHRGGLGSPIKILTASFPAAVKPSDVRAAAEGKPAPHLSAEARPEPPPGLGGGAQPLPSPGSALHGEGTCSPCAWHWKPRGCINAQDCPFCHLCPEGEIKNRKKAKLAARKAEKLTGSTPAGEAPAPATPPLTSSPAPALPASPSAPAAPAPAALQAVAAAPASGAVTVAPTAPAFVSPSFAAPASGGASCPEPSGGPAMLERSGTPKVLELSALL